MKQNPEKKKLDQKNANQLQGQLLLFDEPEEPRRPDRFKVIDDLYKDVKVF